MNTLLNGRLRRDGSFVEAEGVAIAVPVLGPAVASDNLVYDCTDHGLVVPHPRHWFQCARRSRLQPGHFQGSGLGRFLFQGSMFVLRLMLPSYQTLERGMAQGGLMPDNGSVTNERNEMSRIDGMRKIVAERQYGKVEGSRVDLFSASAYVAVYDALTKESSRDLLESMRLPNAMSAVWRLVK